MKKKVVTAFMMAALGSSLVFTQAVMAADTTAKTETSENADKDSTESKDKDVAEDHPVHYRIQPASHIPGNPDLW